MLQAWPNPFNEEATIRFCMPAAASADLVVHNIRGQRVRRLASRLFSTGEHFVQWNGRSDAGSAVASGVYFVRLTVGGEAESIKALLLK
jgi:flagellar hook assembly protein FlgD